MSVSLEIDVTELRTILVQTSRGDTADAVARILPRIEAQQAKGTLELTAWATIIQYALATKMSFLCTCCLFNISCPPSGY